MPVATGVVQALNQRGPYSGQYGEFYSHGINVGGQWYSLLDNSTTPHAPTGQAITQGSTIEFMYETKVGTNGKQNQNIVKKTLTLVTENQAEVPQGNVQAISPKVVQQQPRTYQDNNIGAAVGMSWNCAWSEAVSLANGVPIDLAQVQKRTIEIYKASQEVKELVQSGKHLDEELPFTPDEVHPEV